MKKEKRLFPAQEKSEIVINIIRKHWFVYMMFWLLAVLMSAPLIVLSAVWLNNPDIFSKLIINICVIFIPIYILIILGLLMYGFVDYYLDVYIVTDRRIVDISQNGFFKRTISELNVTEIQDVNAEVNGMLPTFLHFGDVHIQTAGEKPNFIFESVPHPYETSKIILDLHSKTNQKHISKNFELKNSSAREEDLPLRTNDDPNSELLEKLDKHIKDEPNIVRNITETAAGETKGEEKKIEEGILEENKEVDI